MLTPWLAAAVASAAPEWDEEELTAVTAQVLDILPWHHYVLRTQLRHDLPGNFAEIAVFGAPGTFVLPDGSDTGGALLRFGIGAGLGAGKPATGFAAFAGMQFDYALLQDGGVGLLSSSATLGAAASGILYGGMAYEGWTATFGALPVAPLSYREDVGGTPVQGDLDLMFTLYNQEGVAVGGVRGERITGEQVLAALRAEVAPERLLERLDLRRYGLFGVGLQRFASGLDPYLDDPGPAADAPAHAELPLSADDIAEKGFRFQVVPEIAPTPKLRRVQAGYVYAGEKLVVGGQGGILNRAGGLVPSFQAFASFRPEWFRYFSIYGVPRVSLAYSYNVPDPIAFFPIEGAHVFGVQYIYGPQEFARPLLPIYRQKGSGSKKP